MNAPPDTSPAPGEPTAPMVRHIEGRLFVVGCARSGTTLLQSLFAAHPEVLSFPETAVFAGLLGAGVMRSFRVGPADGQAGAHGAVSSRLGSVHRRTQVAYRRATALLDKLGRRDLERVLPMRSKSIREFADGFVGVLDRLALDQDKTWWVEKTPYHINFVPEILRLVPGARFINILRDGRQNVASLYNMACKYSDVWWWAKYRDLDQAIELWNDCIRHTRRLLNVPEVLLVRHERLVSDTEAVVQEMCGFAGLAFSRDMIDRRAEAAGAVVRSAEPWKADVFKPIRSAAEDKFDEVFDAAQKAYIESRLERIDF
jgi:hypothetical protein